MQYLVVAHRNATDDGATAHAADCDEARRLRPRVPSADQRAVLKVDSLTRRPRRQAGGDPAS